KSNNTKHVSFSDYKTVKPIKNTKIHFGDEKEINDDYHNKNSISETNVNVNNYMKVTFDKNTDDIISITNISTNNCEPYSNKEKFPNKTNNIHNNNYTKDTKLTPILKHNHPKFNNQNNDNENNYD